MIEGIRQSGADYQIFRHNDPFGLERRLNEADPSRPKLVCFESMYSMMAISRRLERFAMLPSVWRDDLS
jgi:7-keto-8-aminopelargonate synthetase-like enzyme